MGGLAKPCQMSSELVDGAKGCGVKVQEGSYSQPSLPLCYSVLVQNLGIYQEWVCLQKVVQIQVSRFNETQPFLCFSYPYQIYDLGKQENLAERCLQRIARIQIAQSCYAPD